MTIKRNSTKRPSIFPKGKCPSKKSPKRNERRKESYLNDIYVSHYSKEEQSVSGMIETLYPNNYFRYNTESSLNFMIFKANKIFVMH